MEHKLVEIIGVPGSGKTTIYNSLCQEWNENEGWTHFNNLFYPNKPSISQFMVWMDYHLRRLLKKKFKKSLPVDKGLEFARTHQLLVDFYWKHLSNDDFPANTDMGSRFRSAYFLFKDFCRYQTIQEYSNYLPCVIDEGLLQKSFLIHYDDEKLNEILNEYLDLVCLPKVVVWVNLEPIEEIINRISKRNKIICSHLGKNGNSLEENIKRWQLLIELIVRKIQNNGVTVHQIDGGQPVSNNVDRLKDILCSLSKD